MDSNSKLTKILTSEQIRKTDQYTILNKPVSSIDLMERASRAFVSSFLQHYGISKKIKVFCGIGNNGGDGLAISRLLYEHGCGIQTFCVGTISKSSPDFMINFNRLKEICPPTLLMSASDFPKLSESDIIIDGIFGSGLSRPVTGFYAELINYINCAGAKKVISIDIASGMFSEQHTPNNVAIKCNETITFQIPKLSFYLPQNHDNTGRLTVVDIGLDKEFIQNQLSGFYLVTREYIQSIFKKPKKYAHKGNMGRNLIISGSKGKMGAAILAAKACIRSGAGLVTIYIPECGYNIMQTAVPEAMVITDAGENVITATPSVAMYDSIGVGPGIGLASSTIEAVKDLLVKLDSPIILDADALNIISTYNLMNFIPLGSILTPHPGEFARLVGEWDNDFERLGKQISFSKKYKVVILLKGSNTSISDMSGKVYFNPTGNPGMATGGSGDVLTGVITALMGKGYNSTESAILGAYIHGLAGNLFVKESSEEGLIASDLIDYLPMAFRQVALK